MSRCVCFAAEGSSGRALFDVHAVHPAAVGAHEHRRVEGLPALRAAEVRLLLVLDEDELVVERLVAVAAPGAGFVRAARAIGAQRKAGGKRQVGTHKHHGFAAASSRLVFCRLAAESRPMALPASAARARPARSTERGAAQRQALDQRQSAKKSGPAPWSHSLACGSQCLHESPTCHPTIHSQSLGS